MQSYAKPRRQPPKIPANIQRAYDGNVDLSDFCQKLLSEIDSKSSALNRQVDEFQGQLNHFQSQMSKYQRVKKELADAKLELEDKNNSLTRVEQELSFKRNDLKLLEKRYAEMKISYESQVEELTSQRLQSNFQKRQNEQLLAEIEARERKVKAQYIVIDERQSALAKAERCLQEQLDQHQINVLALKSSQEQLSKQKQVQKSQMAEVQLQFQALNELITYQAKQQHETQKALQALKTKLLEQETELAQLLSEKERKIKLREQQLSNREKDLELLVRQLQADLNKTVADAAIQTGRYETVERGIATSRMALLDMSQQVSAVLGLGDKYQKDTKRIYGVPGKPTKEETSSDETPVRTETVGRPAQAFEQQLLRARGRQQLVQQLGVPETPETPLEKLQKVQVEKQTQRSMRESDLEPPSEARTVRFADGGSQGSLGADCSSEREKQLPKDSNGLVDPEFLETAKSQMNLSRYVREADGL